MTQQRYKSNDNRKLLQTAKQQSGMNRKREKYLRRERNKERFI